jgi:phospholipid/cholesterol/gamma-HCH transport system substrate-binding protein
VEGLAVSNAVKVKGVQVGRVGKIFLGENVTVKIKIDGDVKIPKNSVARIVSSDLLGSRIIELELTNDKDFYEDGDTLFSSQQESLTKSVQAEILPVKEKAENLISSIDSVITIIRTVFNNETRKNIERSVKNISSTLEHINSSSENIDELLEKNTSKLQSIFNNIESITSNLRKNEENITAILSNLNQISDSLAKADLLQTVNNAKETLSQATHILEKINKGEGTIGMLVNDDKLYKNLEQSSKDLDILFQDLKENPGRYVHLSLFGKKDKSSKDEGKK